MSAEYEAAQEICSVLNAIDQNLDRIYKDMPSQRERIATAAMQGMLSRSGHDANHLATLAVSYADALIAELEARHEA